MPRGIPRPRTDDQGGPWFIMRPDTKELLCCTNRLKPSFWSRQWHGAKNYFVKGSAWSAVNVMRKQIGPFDYCLVTEAEAKEEWAKLDKAAAPSSHAREPELLTVTEQEDEPSAFASTPKMEPGPDPAQNELLMNAMGTELSLMNEEAMAYEMWTIAAAKLRNHKLHREFLEASSTKRSRP